MNYFDGDIENDMVLFDEENSEQEHESSYDELYEEEAIEELRRNE